MLIITKQKENLAALHSAQTAFPQKNMVNRGQPPIVFLNFTSMKDKGRKNAQERCRTSLVFQAQLKRGD